MTDQDIWNRLQQIFRDVFRDESLVLTPTMTARDIEKWDSMEQINIVMEAEREFGVRFSARTINALENVGEMVEHIKKTLVAAGKA